MIVGLGCEGGRKAKNDGSEGGGREREFIKRCGGGKRDLTVVGRWKGVV